eukprot:PLAT2807.1.p2 GENE.PLAT2807.1~~PLAT2807.1.p2  ORF type:complete len:284 (-),score=76.40 PLAT2807.1:12-863(-)
MMRRLCTQPQLSARQLLKQTQPSRGTVEMIERLRLGRRRRRRRDRPIERIGDGYTAVPPHVQALWTSALRLEQSAERWEQLPEEGVPEIAFAGRSNVGKSSLLNALTQKGLAAVQDKPGVTQNLDFYRMGPKHVSRPPQLMLVDLPGYGFAFASEERIQSWNTLMRRYLTSRGNVLKRACIVVDARQGVKPADLELMELLDSVWSPRWYNRQRKGVRYQLILTKCDLIPPRELAQRVTLLLGDLQERPALLPQQPLICLSSRTHAGVLPLQLALAGLSTRKKQ